MDSTTWTGGHPERVPPSFPPTAKGSYQFSLIVNDGVADSKADKVIVRVQKAP